jgi:Icc-related predicted phosphoesterase
VNKVRVAAVGDVHAGLDSAGCFRAQFEHLAERADVLLLAGDLTRHGDPEEAAVLVDDLRDVEVPVIAVLGNHDHHGDAGDQIRDVLESGGICALEGEGAVVKVDGTRVGVAGAKGFGGGFAGACATDFGEPEMKAFIRHTRHVADRLHGVLDDLAHESDVRIALLHYSPVEDTLRGERLEIYPFLGSYLLAEAIDRAGADLVIHGHAHGGVEKGLTPGGIHVRNVAQPVLKHAYHVYCLGGEDGTTCD